MMFRTKCLLVVAVLATAATAQAHSGRRFVVEVVDGKLQAQGLNTGTDDGAPALRPYLNAIHDHWHNFTGLNLATASLPGFDISSSAVSLQAHDLWLDLVQVRKWVNPPLMPTEETRPLLQPLDPGEVITLYGNNDTNSEQLGSILLAENLPFGGVTDLDLLYQINSLPSNEIHVLEFQLYATYYGGGIDPTLAPSDTAYAVLSPDGDTPAIRLHHASLYLESYLATVPEPPALVGVLLLALPAYGWVRGRRAAA